MEKDPKRFALSRFMMSPEEVENYSKLPMDMYTRTNDPELYEKIDHAKRINEAIGMSSGFGGPMGMIGAVSNLTKKKAFSNIINLIKTRDPKIKDILEKIKSFPEKEKQEFLDYYKRNTDYFPQNETQSLGKVISEDIPEKIGNVMVKGTPEEKIGKVILKGNKPESITEPEMLSEEAEELLKHWKLK